MRPARVGALLAAALLLVPSGSTASEAGEPAEGARAEAPRRVSGAVSCEGYLLTDTSMFQGALAGALAGSRDPAWRKANGLEEPGFDGLDTKGRLDCLHRLISRQYCEARKLEESYARWLEHRAADSLAERETGRRLYPRDEVCSWPEGRYRLQAEHLEYGRDLKSRLERDYPLGWRVLRDSAPDRAAFERTLSDIQNRSALRLDELGQSRAECDRVRAGLVTQAQAKVESALTGASPAAGEEAHRAFDGSRSAAAVEAGKLTEGIRFSAQSLAFPDGRRLSARRVRAIAEKGLRQLASTPAGAETLASLQAVREKFAREPHWFLGAHAQRTLAVRKELEALETRAKAVSGTELEELRKRVDGTRDFLKRLEAELRLLESRKGRKPEVVVFIGDAGPMAAGWAEPLSILPGKDGGLFTRVRLSGNLLEDANPSRSLTFVLGHELKHMSDALPMRLAGFQSIHWHAFEDRAYLAEAKVIMEQSEALRAAGEPASGRLERSRLYTLRAMVLHPESFRLRYLSHPLYLWNVSPADLEDPDRAVRSRLQRVFELMGSHPRDDDIPRRVDPSGHLRSLFDIVRSTPEGGRRDDALAKRVFVESALSLGYADPWRSEVSELASAAGRPGKMNVVLQGLLSREEEYHRELADFVQRQRASVP